MSGYGAEFRISDLEFGCRMELAHLCPRSRSSDIFEQSGKGHLVCLLVLLVGWPVGCLVGWFVCLLVGGSVGWVLLVGWLFVFVGCLVAGSADVSCLTPGQPSLRETCAKLARALRQKYGSARSSLSSTNQAVNKPVGWLVGWLVACGQPSSQLAWTIKLGM